MPSRVSSADLATAAAYVGLDVQHDCGGYRIVKDGRNIFPSEGTCPTDTRRACMAFVLGYRSALRIQSTLKTPAADISPRLC